ERRERRLVLVVTNGKKTEPNYFNAFKTLLPKGTLEPYFVEFHEGNQKQVVECAVAKHKEEKYDEVWAVLDVEDHDPDSNSFPAALALAKKNGVEVVYSNRQIEVWFLFHFPQGREIDQSMQGCKTIEKLNECLFSTGIQEGYKKSHSVFNVLLHHGEEPAAINHAEEILIKARKKFPNEEWRYNPSTTVHRLVKRLREMVEP
ncbi:MAG: RloB family protein, partial [Planctomycetaceae bacterium]|nr:RloB family protein [Planctomycetaceae bacterium]